MPKRKFIAGGFVLVIALAFLIYKGCSLSVPYYTVSDLISQGDSVYSQKVRIIGIVAPDTLEQRSSASYISFILADGKLRLPVSYDGTIPGRLGEGKEVVIEGEYTPRGIFEASNILTRCPSRYVPNQQGTEAQ